MTIFMIINILMVIVTFAGIVGLGLVSFTKNKVEEVIDDTPKERVVDRYSIERPSINAVYVEDSSFLEGLIVRYTKKFIRSEVLEGSAKVNEYTRIPIYESDFDSHIESITNMIYESLSLNYIDRMEYHYYRNLKLHIKLLVNDLYISEINILKNDKKLIARDKNKSYEAEDSELSIISAIDEVNAKLGVSNEAIKDILLEVIPEFDSLEMLRHSNLPSTQNIINEFDRINEIVSSRDIDIRSILTYLDKK